jgi:hypothetical protein
MKIIICGSRDFDDYPRLKTELDRLTAKLDDIVVVTGAQESKDPRTGRKWGADYLAEKWALANGISVERYHADWSKHGKQAGPIRNTEMINESGAKALIAFWDGESLGTKDVIEKARKKGLKVRIIRF